MTDLELTRLCAEAMGIADTHFIDQSYDGDFQMWPCLQDDTDYDPLHDDAQAMALVKKLSLQIHHHGFACSRASLVTVSGKWLPYGPEFRVVGKDDGAMNAENKAICECVAKMMAGKFPCATPTLYAPQPCCEDWNKCRRPCIPRAEEPCEDEHCRVERLAGNPDPHKAAPGPKPPPKGWPEVG